MAAITSGTIKSTVLGDFVIGTLELAPTADDGDTINLSGSNFLNGDKVKGIIYAEGVRNAAQTGSVDISPISFSAGTAKLTLGNSGTQNTAAVDGTTALAKGIDEGRTSLSNYRRDIFFIGKSTTA